MADITMSLDDTLELDAVIKEWNDPSNIVEDSNDKFNMSGFYTGTRVLDPQESGTHTIKVNGQELTVEVTDPSTIPNSVENNMDLLWKADEGSGSTVDDSIGNNPATLTGGWVSGSQYAGGATMDMSTDGDRVISDSQIGLNGASQSVACWVSFDSFSDTSSGDPRILHMGDQTDGSESRDDGWYVRTDGSNVNIVNGSLGGSNASQPLNVSVNLSSGKQYMIAATVSGDTYELYIYDTSQQLAKGSNTDSGNRVGTTDTYLYGMREPNKGTADGQQDYVMANFSTALSESKFDQIHSDTKSGR